jgi:DEAD/DEAH box helicase domain-containing protein
MCDRHDLGVAVGDNGQGEARVERGFNRRRETRATGGGSGGAGESPLLDGGAGFTSAPREDYEPNVFIYDNYPGGIGLSEPLYRLHSRLLAESRSLIAACPCREGCPSCVGPAGEAGTRGKEVALALLDAVLGR